MTQAVVTAANEITAAICSVDGNKPDGVCESKAVLAAEQALKAAAHTPLTERRPRRADAAGAGVRRPGQLARRSSISLRSTSFMPPQIPWGSRILMA